VRCGRLCRVGEATTVGYLLRASPTNTGATASVESTNTEHVFAKVMRVASLRRYPPALYGQALGARNHEPKYSEHGSLVGV
jgi:hypothetical protein